VSTDPRQQRLHVVGQRLTSAGHAEPRNHVEKTGPELRRSGDPLVGRRRTDQEYRVQPGVDQYLSQRPSFLDGVIEQQYAVHPGVPGLSCKGGRIHPDDRVRISEENDRRVVSLAEPPDEIQRAAQRHPRGQGALAGALNHRAIGQWIGERHTHFNRVRAAARNRVEDSRRPLGVRIASRDVGDEPAFPAALQRCEPICEP